MSQSKSESRPKWRTAEIIYTLLYFSWPHVAIETTGQISITQCTCQVLGEAKCCHVAALLYLLLDVKETGNPLLCQSTTDTTCYWAKGSSRVKDSRPLHLIKTGKKCRQNDRYIDIDPRPEEQRKTTIAEVNKFYVDANTCKCGKRPCNCTSNWVAKKVISIKILPPTSTICQRVRCWACHVRLHFFTLFGTKQPDNAISFRNGWNKC